MKELNANDMDQVSGGTGENNPPAMVGGLAMFYCKSCNKTFQSSKGTQYYGICPDCGLRGKSV